jgi:hypothetical protein
MPVMNLLMTAKDCMDTLVNLYEKQDPSQKSTLNKNINYLNMEKVESVGDGVIVDDDDLVQTIFYSLPSSWETILSSVSGREIQATFERLWHDYLQEESHTTTRSKPTKEEHSSLASRFKGKKKGTFQKGSQRKPNTKGTFKRKNIDTYKIKCFSCNKLGHFAKYCWFRKKYPRKGKHRASTTEDGESKKIIKFLRMRNKIEKNITWFLPYPVQFSWGRKLG